MNSIEIKSQYTVEDYIRTETFLKNLNKPNSFIINFGCLFIFGCLLFDLFIAFEAYKRQDYEKAYILFVLFALGSFAIYKIVSHFNPSLYLWAFKRKIQHAHDSDAMEFFEREIIFSEDGIQETNKFGKYLTYWKTISNVTETEDDFYFYLPTSGSFQPKREISEDQQVFIPKRAFKSDKDLAFVKRLITKKLAAKQSVEFSTPEANTHRAKRRKRQFRNAGNSSFSRRRLAKING